MHRRQIIRDAMVQHLLGLGPTGSRVYPMRARILGENELPAIRIYTPSDRRDKPDAGMLLSGASIDRVAVRVELLAKAADTVEETIDALSELVEQRIAENPTLGGAVQWISYESTEVDFEDEDETVMQATLVFEAEYPTE